MRPEAPGRVRPAGFLATGWLAAGWLATGWLAAGWLQAAGWLGFAEPTPIFGIDSRWLFVGLIGLVALQRLVELAVSRRNARAALARGAVEFGRGHYPWMVALHASFLVITPLEVWGLGRAFRPVLALPMLALLVAATGLRFWTLATLGDRWTTRVICEPGRPLVTGGPYRFVRHPNYLAVVVELFALPLLHSAWISAAMFSILNAVLLRIRLRVEAQALASCAESREEWILSEVRSLARERFGWDGPLAVEMSLVEDFGLDSMKALALAVEVENRFRIRIDEQAETELVSVGDLVRTIEAELDRESGSERRPRAEPGVS